MAIPFWKRAIIMTTAKMKTSQIYKRYTPELEEIKDKIADLVEKVPEKDQLMITIISCSEILSGWETEADMMFCVDMIKETLKNIAKERGAIAQTTTPE